MSTNIEGRIADSRDLVQSLPVYESLQESAPLQRAFI